MWRINEAWRVEAGEGFEYLIDWEGEFGGHTAKLDFIRSIYGTIGLQREFQVS